jgi:hypothetical protein
MANISASEKDGIKLYLMLMEEAKIRLDAINITYKNEPLLPPGLVRELCYLQLRFLCEIVALACLAAHGDVTKSKALRSTYEPGKILKQIELLKAHFYPQPMDFDKTNGNTQMRSRPDRLHLTKKELPKLWARSGAVLHRTPMAKLYAPPKQAPHDFSDVIDWAQKIVGLLNGHWITTMENRRGLYVTLRSPDTPKAKISVLTFDHAGRSLHVGTYTL